MVEWMAYSRLYRRFAMKPIVPIIVFSVTVTLLGSTAIVQSQDVIQSLTPEQRQQIQANLPDLRSEIQTLTPAQQADRVTKFFAEFQDLTPTQRQRLTTIILEQVGNQPSQPRPSEPRPSEPRPSQPPPNNPPQSPAPQNTVADPDNPFNHSLTALTDFGTTTYLGRKGGLYPEGSNERPAAHTAEGLRIAQSIKPLDTDGNVDEANGRIVWLSIGMSNTGQATTGFFEVMLNYVDKNPKLALVNGAFGGQAINQINNPAGGYWNNIVEQRLKPQGLTPEQVQIVWFKQAEMGPTNTDFEEYTAELKVKYASVMRILKQKYPNLKLVYLSPRTYAGYATTRLNPEPFAWYTGWTIKFLIEEQIAGSPELRFKGDDAPVAWLSWGPYLWANGENPNANGLFYLQSDYSSDGTHPDHRGVQKIAREMFRFFTTDETTVPWFVRQ